MGQIVNAFGAQSDYFEMTVNKRDKACECCDLVTLAMCVFNTPGQALRFVLRDSKELGRIFSF